jgi:GNAT superfamily N-acetyltransferase
VSEAGPVAVRSLAAWARARGARLNIEVPAVPASDQLIASLLESGATEADPIDLLLGPLTDPGEVTAELRTVVARSPEATQFASTLALGHGAPDERPAAMDDAVAAFAGEPAWTCLLATVDGAPAGASVLTIDGTIGYLANASVLPAARGRGLQTAMIAHRAAVAGAAGCTTLASLARPGSPSHRNLQRAGLEVACGLRTLVLG